MILLISDPKILAITIIDNKEELIDLKHQQEIAYTAYPEYSETYDDACYTSKLQCYTKLRKTVYEKLKQAQSLLPKALRLCLCDGYRSLDVQKVIFDNWFAEIQNKHPEWSKEQVFTEATKFVAPVINKDSTKNIPPHSTGGAVDVYLIDDKGECVDMGIYPPNWMEEDKDGSISATLSNKISPQAQKNRKIMGDALSTVGFINYPTEYWHWSYGDRYWAYYSNQPHAIYGSYESDNLVAK